MNKNGIYSNNTQGKQEFVENILTPLVENENHFKTCRYINTDTSEMIEIIPWSKQEGSILIDVTADSVSALARDFCKHFTNIINQKIKEG